jgi:hypothetical protein
LILNSKFFICHSQIDDLNLNWLIPTPDSTIPQVLVSDPLRNKTYIGGDINSIQNSTPRIGSFDPNTNEVFQNKLKVNGRISVSIPDDNGGYFIAGEFTEVNGQSRNRLAHVDQNNLLTSFEADVDDSIVCMSLYNGKLYFGGEFTSVNGVYTGPISAVDAVTGNLVSWSPSVNGHVYSILATSQGVFIGGYFSTVNGNYSPYMASINPINGTINTWNHNINGPVFDFKINDGFLFCVGGFSSVNGQSRSCFAQFDLINLALTPLNIGIVDYDPGEWGILGLEVMNSKLYLFGEFDAIAGNQRNNIAVFDLLTEQISSTTFNTNGNFLIPNYTGIVHDAFIFNEFIYFGGAFFTINSSSHSHLFRADTLTDTVDSWDLNLIGQVYSISSLGNRLTVCGEIRHMGNLPATNLMTFETSSGELSNIQHTVNGEVRSMEIEGNSLIVLGDFNEFDGIQKNKLAIVDLNTDLLTGFSTSFFDTINLYSHAKPIFRKNNNKLYFSLDSSIYAVSLINPSTIQQIVELTNYGAGNTPASIRNFHLFGDTLIINGVFNSCNGIPTTSILFYSMSNESILNSFNSLFQTVVATTLDDTLLYYAQYDSGFQFSISTVNLLNLNQTLISNLINYGQITTINKAYNKLYFSGYNYGERVVKRIDLLTNSIETWKVFTDNIVKEIEYSPGKVFLIGNFHFVQDLPVTFLSVFNTCENSTTTNVSTNCLYNWNGNDFYNSGIYNQVFTNVSGCDSIAFLNLEILNSESYSEVIACSTTYSTLYSTYTSSGNYIEIYQNVYSCDSIVTLNLTLLNSSSANEIVTACDSFTWPINNQTYTTSGQYIDTIPNVAGCDSIITLDLTIIPSLPLTISNYFSLPSDATTCVGELAVSVSGNADFELNVDNGTLIVNTSGYSLINNLCPGVHDLLVTDNCGDSLITQIVIPIDSNYVFNNPFIDSIAMDSLGSTITNCDIYYNQIDTAYIDSIWATGNTVNVIWNIVDSNGSNFDTSSYVLNNGNGVYWLQLSVFCPTKALGDYFTVTEAIYFNDGTISMADLAENTFQFALYPNPTNNEVTLTFDSKEAQVIIYDTQGKLIQTKIIHSGEQVSLKEVETGVYFFEVVTEKGTAVKRLVKN